MPKTVTYGVRCGGLYGADTLGSSRTTDLLERVTVRVRGCLQILHELLLWSYMPEQN